MYKYLIVATLWLMLSCKQTPPAGDEQYYRYFNPYQLTGSQPIKHPLRQGWSYGIKEYRATLPHNRHSCHIKIAYLYKDGKLLRTAKYTADLQTDSTAYHTVFVPSNGCPRRYYYVPEEVSTRIRTVKNNHITDIIYVQDLSASSLSRIYIEKFYADGVDSSFSISSDTFSISNLQNPFFLQKNYSLCCIISKDSNGVATRRCYNGLGYPTEYVEYLRHDIYPFEWL